MTAFTRQKREKYKAVIEEIEKMVAAGRPVLVGTTSVEISEMLSKMLTMRKIEHSVLNAKLHQKEADIVATAAFEMCCKPRYQYGSPCTDIKLSPEVKVAGGLAIGRYRTPRITPCARPARDRRDQRDRSRARSA